MLAVVTGASRGLGRLCAHELAAQGANLLLIARDQVALTDVAVEIKVKYPGREVTTLGCDLGDHDAPQRVREAADQLGRADILVNNAAVQGPIGPTWEVPWHEFEEALRFDFLVPVALCRALIPSMKARGRGWIINISGGGATGPRPMFAAYAAAKTALVRFTETLAIEADDTIERLHAMGFWLEIVTLLIPGFNDSRDELMRLTAFVAGVSPDIPWHVTAFHGDYKMTGPGNTTARMLAGAALIGRGNGLRHVYAGNLPGQVGDLEDTRCASCKTTLVARSGYHVRNYRVTADGRCPACATPVPGRWDAGFSGQIADRPIARRLELRAKT